MMLQILRKFIEGVEQVTEYTRDGVTVSHIVRTPLQIEQPQPEPQEPQPTLEELQAQTLMNTEMLLVYSELGM